MMLAKLRASAVMMSRSQSKPVVQGSDQAEKRAIAVAPCSADLRGWVYKRLERATTGCCPSTHVRLAGWLPVQCDPVS